MKKLLLPLILFLMLLKTPASAEYVTRLTPAPTAVPQLQLKPSDDEVKVYANPTVSSKIVGYIIVGGYQEVKVLRGQDAWYYVSFSSIYGTSYGWIPAACFEPMPAPAPSITPTPDPSYLYGQDAFINNLEKGVRLNLRTSPSASATSLGKYYTGTPVKLLGEHRSGYVRVQIGTVTGWVDSRYITNDGYSFVSELPQVFVVNPGGGLNLRSGPGTDHDRIGWYPHGSAITVLGIRADEWYHVAIGGQTGFMSSTLMSETFPWHLDAEGSSGTVSGSTAYVSNSVSSGLHLRKSASASSESMGVFYPGCPVQVISYTRTGWALVQVACYQGYMDASSLSSLRPSQTGRTRMIHNPYGTGLNLRTLPNTNSNIIRLCGNYTYVTVLADLQNDWCYVQSGSDNGYMMGTRLTGR